MLLKSNNIILNQWTLLTLILVFICSTLFIHQELIPTDRDESRFAQASKQMLISGDYLVIRFQEEWRAKKPAGIYWLQSFSAGVFGKKDISSYRLPSLLAAIGTLFLVYFFSPSFGLKSDRGRVLATGLLLATFTFNIEAILAKTDSTLLFFCTLMQICLWKIFSTSQNSTSLIYVFGFWSSLAFSFLIKGPIGLFLASTTILGISLLKKNLNWLSNLRSVSGLFIFLIIASPWYLLIILETNGEFIKLAFFEDFASKVTSGQESHGAPPGTFLALTMFIFFPASFYLRYLWVGVTKTFPTDVGKFLIVWIAGFWFLIELTPTKLPHYVLPTFPAIAILCALGIEKSTEETFRGMIKYIWPVFCVLITFILFGGLVWLIVNLSETQRPQAIFWLLLALVAISLCLWWSLSTNLDLLKRNFVSFLLAFLIFHFSVFYGILTNLDRTFVSQNIIKEIEKITSIRNDAVTKIYTIGYNEPSLVFLTDKVIGGTILRPQKDSVGEIAKKFAADNNSIALIEKRHLKKFTNALKLLKDDTEIVTIIKGVNISRGQDVEISLFKHANLDYD